MRTTLRRLGGWTLCVPVAVLGLAACGTGPHDAGSAAPLTTTAPTKTSPTTATATAKTVAEARDEDDDDHSNSAGGSGRSDQQGGHTAPTAKVVHLTVTQQPSCPVHGTPEAPFSAPGQDVVLSWQVSGADGAAIGVDNPHTYGAYGSDYPASGAQSFAFGCEGDTGSTSHTFTVWPKGHPETSKTITVSARNNP